MRYLFGFTLVLALGVMPVVGCSEAAECQNAEDCNDGNDCSEDACIGGVCEHPPVADGTACGNDAGTCQQGSCQVACSEQGIREAIAAGGGPYTFDCDRPTTVETEAGFYINNDVILDGEGNLTVDGNEDHGVFGIDGSATVELRGFTITKGFPGPGHQGGGIWVAGTLTLTNSTVSGNTAYVGGGIWTTGTLTLTNSTVSGNTATANGGGIYTSTGTLTLTNSAVSGNSASGGGGISNHAILTLTNSTVSGNTAEGGNGGGIGNTGLLTLTNSTVSDNAAAGDGGGVYNGGLHPLTLTNSTVSGNAADVGGGIWNAATLTLTNSTVSGNTADRGSGLVLDRLPVVWGDSRPPSQSLTNTLVDNDCVSHAIGETLSGGGNIESPGDTCGFDQPTDRPKTTVARLNLGELADNGGPTMTHKPGPGSAAIDQIPADDCHLTEDQRGEPRPETGGTMCDVGSVEVQPEL